MKAVSLQLKYRLFLSFLYLKLALTPAEQKKNTDLHNTWCKEYVHLWNVEQKFIFF